MLKELKILHKTKMKHSKIDIATCLSVLAPISYIHHLIEIVNKLTSGILFYYAPLYKLAYNCINIQFNIEKQIFYILEI